MTTRTVIDGRRGVEIAAVAGLVGALVVALAVPPEQTQGNVARLLFAHMPSTWIAYAAFGVTLSGSVAYLVTRSIRWDRLASASAEVGVYFTGVTITIGMIWAKPTWTVWWTWDAWLVLTAVLFFVYLSYLALRRAIPDREVRARRASIFGALAIVQVPIVAFSVVWWRSLHQPPTVLRPGPLQMDPPFWAALWVSLVAFTVAYVALVWRRIDLARIEEEVEAARSERDVEVAGAAVTAPRFDRLIDDVTDWDRRV